MSVIVNPGGAGGAASFTTLTGGTNTGNSFVLGNGSSISTTGTGTIGAGGSDTQVQFNNAGTLAGTSAATIVSSRLTVSANGLQIPTNASIGDILGGGSRLNFGNDLVFTTFGGSLFTTNNAIKIGETNIPSGLASFSMLAADVTTHTLSHNSNNNGVMSFSGAWVNTNVTPVTVNANTAAAQNLMSVSIPAGTLNRVGRSLRIWLTGVYTLTAVASTTTIAVKLGALTLISIVDTSVAGGVTNGQFNLLAYATTQTSGASRALESHGHLVIELGTTGAVADSVFADSNTATVSTVDLTAAQTLQVTVTFSNASASNSATQRQMVLETVG